MHNGSPKLSLEPRVECIPRLRQRGPIFPDHKNGESAAARSVPQRDLLSPQALRRRLQVKSSHNRRAVSTSFSVPAASAPARPVILSLGIAMTLSTITCDCFLRPVDLPAGTAMRK